MVTLLDGIPLTSRRHAQQRGPRRTPRLWTQLNPHQLGVERRSSAREPGLRADDAFFDEPALATSSAVALRKWPVMSSSREPWGGISSWINFSDFGLLLRQRSFFVFARLTRRPLRERGYGVGRGGSRCRVGLLKLAVDLFAMDGHVSRCGNTQTDGVTVDLQHRDDNVVTDDEALLRTSAEHEHVRVLSPAAGMSPTLSGDARRVRQVSDRGRGTLRTRAAADAARRADRSGPLGRHLGCVR